MSFARSGIRQWPQRRSVVFPPPGVTGSGRRTGAILVSPESRSAGRKAGDCASCEPGGAIRVASGSAAENAAESCEERPDGAIIVAASSWLPVDGPGGGCTPGGGLTGIGGTNAGG